METLERVEAIRRHPVFREALEKIEEAEKDRIYCRHDIGHLLDTARIGRILALEEGAGLRADVIYAAALLHDLGRAAEYESGAPHDEAGIVTAKEILSDTSFDEDEKKMIIEAVAGHRGTEDGGERGDLAGILRRADKLSRRCWACGAADTCKWPDEKKNMGVFV